MVYITLGTRCFMVRWAVAMPNIGGVITNAISDSPSEPLRSCREIYVVFGGIILNPGG